MYPRGTNLVFASDSVLTLRLLAGPSPAFVHITLSPRKAKPLGVSFFVVLSFRRGCLLSGVQTGRSREAPTARD